MYIRILVDHHHRCVKRHIGDLELTRFDVDQTKSADIAFLDAVANRTTRSAIELLGPILEASAEPVVVVQLHRRLRELLEILARLEEGETKNYSEDFHANELVFINKSLPNEDEVIAVPEKFLANKQPITHPQLPFTVTVKDDTAPMITCPDNITVGNDQGICGAKVDYGTVKAGDLVFGYSNQDSVRHTLIIAKDNVKVPNFKLVIPQKGANDSGTVTLSAGTYVLLCDVPGHSNMKATLVVTP